MLKIHWCDLRENVLILKDDTEWRMYTDFDELEDACIYLEVNGEKYVICSSDEYCLGREQMPLCSYDVIDFYDAVVRYIYEMIQDDGTKSLDLVAIQKDLLKEHWWPKWKSNGIVDDDYWE